MANKKSSDSITYNKSIFYCKKVVIKRNELGLTNNQFSLTNH